MGIKFFEKGLGNDILDLTLRAKAKKQNNQ